MEDTVSRERTGWRDAALSARHREWGDNCPAVDADFLLVEYNRAIPTAIVDYKHATLGGIIQPNAATTLALGSLYTKEGEQLPFFIARYWPETWAFKIRPMNDAARSLLEGERWVPMTERQWATFLYRIRQRVLTIGDQRTIDRLNTVLPPEDA